MSAFSCLLCPQLAVSLNIGLELLQLSLSLSCSSCCWVVATCPFIFATVCFLLQLLSGGLGVGLKLRGNPNQSIASDYGFSLALAFLCEM